MRGKRGQFRGTGLDGRIIPARAGQTSLVRAFVAAVSDHPRACGANVSAEVDDFLQCGSSPRVRGKLLQHVPAHAVRRIIPARAGQTAPYWPPWPWRPDHPRACGANGVDCGGHFVLSGSSPRVRGKQPVGVNYHYRQRIIPARAGQTSFAVRCAEVMSDHPRACGANDLSFTDLRGADGSSPRVRGKLLHGRLLRRQRRIIPARAGQTSACVRTSPTRSDHPRACGANSTAALLCVCSDHPRACGANENHFLQGERTDGSSPRVRGKPLAPAGHMAFARIIPARAGQTFQRSKTWQPTPDHPRACGANPFSGLAVALIAGSSPRVRGKQDS